MRAKWLACVIVLTCFLVGCGSAKGTTSQLAWSSRSPPFVVLGDSVSAGPYVPGDAASPRFLAADLHTELVVYAVPGHTPAQTFRMYVIELAPTYVVIDLGTKDY